jgi:glyoxylase-like metal-dependent hydrolase (beta-lactamase superfamily II)
MSRPFRIWENIYIIGSSEISHPYDCCVYLIDVGELVLIDSGAGRSFDRLVDNIVSLELAPEKVSTVIVTHRHIDHIGSLAEFRQKYGARIIAHSLDAEAIETGKSTGADAYGVDYEPCQVDVKLEGAEERLTFGGQEFIALHIPGHTKGSIAIYMDVGGKRVLFGQDIHGPYEAMWGGEPEKAIISLQSLADLEADILCEGHFGIYQPAEEVKNYIEGYLRQLKRGWG